MVTKRHLAASIRGMLNNYKNRSMEGLIIDDQGKVRNYLNECLDKGWRLIPVGDCDGFDHQTGCPGHII